MRFSVTKLQIRSFSAGLVIWFMVAAGSTADDHFPNELNSDVDEPKVQLHDGIVRTAFQVSSLASVQTNDSLVRLCLETRESQRRRLLTTEEHTPWQIMHGLLALRRDFVIRSNGKPISGLNWVSEGPTFRDEFWFEKTKHGGRAHPYSVPYAFEGHCNQFLAILSMSGLPLEHQFHTADGPITMRDMLRHAQQTVRTENPKEELTWTLWALSRYLPPDAQWKNEKGELWSIEKLVELETEKSLQVPLPCGGTHNLFALAHARNVYLRTGKPLRGVWLKSENKLRKYIQTARIQQNANGTLSSNFFRGKEYKKDFDKRMASAGHILEFLMIALPQEELSEPWVRRAIEATCRDLMDNRHEYVSCSPLYHTVNALSIYIDRVVPAAAPKNLAETEPKARAISRSQQIASANKPARVPSDTIAMVTPETENASPDLTIPGSTEALKTGPSSEQSGSGSPSTEESPPTQQEASENTDPEVESASEMQIPLDEMPVPPPLPAPASDPGGSSIGLNEVGDVADLEARIQAVRDSLAATVIHPINQLADADQQQEKKPAERLPLQPASSQTKRPRIVQGGDKERWKTTRPERRRPVVNPQ